MAYRLSFGTPGALTFLMRKVKLGTFLWPAAHLHLHLAPVRRAPGVIRHLAAAEFGAGLFFDPVDPWQAAAQLRSPSA